MKSHSFLSAALALFTIAGAQAGTRTTYTATDKGVAPTQPPAPMVEGPSYSNVELLYAYTDFDTNNGDGHANGGQLNIEYSPMKHFYVTAGAEYYSQDNIDLWTVHGGIGAYWEITPNIHIAADGGILWTDVEYDNVASGDDSDSDTGWYVRPHLRGKWGRFEAKLGALYRDLGDFNAAGEDGRWAGFAQVYYGLTPTLDLTAGVLVDEDFTQVSGGIRWRF